MCPQGRVRVARRRGYAALMLAVAPRYPCGHTGLPRTIDKMYNLWYNGVIDCGGHNRGRHGLGT